MSLNNWGINVSWSSFNHRVCVEITCDCNEWYPCFNLETTDLGSIDIPVNEWLEKHEHDTCPECGATFGGLDP